MRTYDAPKGKKVFEDEHGWYYTNHEFDLFSGPSGDFVDVRYYVKYKPKRRPRVIRDPRDFETYELF